MQNSFLVQVFEGILPEEEPRLRKFLQSPLHNRRQDVLDLFEWMSIQRRAKGAAFQKEDAFAAVYPGQTYDADIFNLTMRYLLDRIEHFLAYEEWQSDPFQYRLHLLRALHRRGAGAHFERQAQRLEQLQEAR